MKKEILVVDDEDSIQELIKVYLSPLNVRIHSAFTGEDAVKMYEEMMYRGRKPSIVIMDLKLPGIDGMQTSTDSRHFPIRYGHRKCSGQVQGRSFHEAWDSTG